MKTREQIEEEIERLLEDDRLNAPARRKPELTTGVAANMDVALSEEQERALDQIMGKAEARLLLD